MAKDTEQVMKPPRKAKEPNVLVPSRTMNKEGAKGIIPVQPRKQRQIAGSSGGVKKTLTRR